MAIKHYLALSCYAVTLYFFATGCQSVLPALGGMVSVSSAIPVRSIRPTRFSKNRVGLTVTQWLSTQSRPHRTDLHPLKPGFDRRVICRKRLHLIFILNFDNSQPIRPLGMEHGPVDDGDPLSVLSAQ